MRADKYMTPSVLALLALAKTSNLAADYAAIRACRWSIWLPSCPSKRLCRPREAKKRPRGYLEGAAEVIHDDLEALGAGALLRVWKAVGNSHWKRSRCRQLSRRAQLAAELPLRRATREFLRTSRSR